MSSLNPLLVEPSWQALSASQDSLIRHLRKQLTNSLPLFANYVFPGYRQATHLSVLMDALMQLEAGEIKRLIVSCPPRHGKSLTTSEIFPAWFLVRNPLERVILTSYSEGLANRLSRHVRQIFEEPAFYQVFGITTTRLSRSVSAWDLDNLHGGMIAAGVGSGITGHGAHLLIVDDPIKDALEAESAVYRERLWDWWTTTAYTRLMEEGAVVIIATRWHHDDLVGRILASASQTGGETWEVLNMPALDWERDSVALWPARYSLDQLERIRVSIGERAFEALYQGNPQPRLGAMFQRGWVQVVDEAPMAGRRVRYWDRAASARGGSYTCGVLLAEFQGKYYVEDVVRGRWAPGDRDALIRAVAEADRERYGTLATVFEREPGSSGVDTWLATLRLLAGFSVFDDRPRGSKPLRADPLSVQMQGGNVLLVRGDWNGAYVDELLAFPVGAQDDQVDASAGAFNWLVRSVAAPLSLEQPGQASRWGQRSGSKWRGVS